MRVETALQDRLVAAGVELLDEQGPAEVTLRAVARRVGVSHGAPRRYFPTHNALLAAIAAKGLNDLAVRLAPILDGGDDAERRLVALGVEYLGFAQRRATMFALMFRHDLLDGAGSNLRATSLPLFHALVGLVGEVVEDDVVQRALGIWTSIHGIAVLAAHGSLRLVDPALDEDAVIARAVRVQLGASPA